MNLRLHVSPFYDVSDYSQGRHIRFVVIDLDQSNEYSANYVCMLPRDPTLHANGTTRNIFSKLSGHGSVELAQRLLTQALATETDAEIKAAIERRLTLLEPKPAG